VAERAITGDLEFLISKAVDIKKADYAVVTGVPLYHTFSTPALADQDDHRGGGYTRLLIPFSLRNLMLKLKQQKGCALRRHNSPIVVGVSNQ